jgi:hypothetical protein
MSTGKYPIIFVAPKVAEPSVIPFQIEQEFFSISARSFWMSLLSKFYYIIVAGICQFQANLFTGSLSMLSSNINENFKISYFLLICLLVLSDLLCTTSFL